MAELIFDKYEIQHRLAVGGMGEVFYAVQRGVKGFERPVILKSLLPDLAQQEGFIDQFLDEARVAATLNHPNVVSIYEVGLWNGVYFIAMEYIRGRNLSQLMKKAIGDQKLPVPQVMVRIVRDAALGLEHAHHALDGQGLPLNIVHRDVSPQNIMVRDDGVTKVVDFGIARASNRSTRTATGAVKGKLAYMAPEQILGRPVTPLADQFALGIVLWEMLAARRLFQAEQDVDLIRKVLEATIPAPSVVNPKVDPGLDALVLQMVNRDPARRFPSCAQAAQALEDWLAQHTAGSITPAAFMQVLGTEDLTIFPKATPSASHNFVISLKENKGKSTPASTVLPTSTGVPMLKSSEVQLVQPQGRRAGVILGGVLALALAALGLWWLSAPAPPPLEKVAEATPPPKPPPADPVRPGPPTPPDPVDPPQPAIIVFKSDPPGAELRLDGRLVGKTPHRAEQVTPGLHPLQLEKPGYRRLDEELRAEPGEQRELSFKLTPLERRPQPEAPAPIGGPGFLTLNTSPWTKVALGDEALGSTPLFKRRLPAGHHLVLLTNEGAGISVKKAIDIEPGKETKLSFSLK